MSMRSIRLGFGAAAAALLAACGGGGDTAAPAASADAASVPFAGALQPAPAGISGNVTCTNLALGAVSVDSVIVPAHAACQLRGTRLNGSIVVNTGAVLDAADVSVIGNLQAEGAADVLVNGASSFGGSVQIKQGSSATIRNARITGDLQFDAQRGPVLAAGNRVNGNLQAFGNRGGVSLIGNAINGNLQCKENVPAPTGSGNTAASKEDQCRWL